MISIKYFFHRVQDVKLSDIIQIIPMSVGWLISPVYKKRYKHVWLICEEKKEARDNGFCFFKRMNEIEPDQKCIYAIDKKSVDYNKVKSIGTIIQYGSIKHWIAYFCCEYNISSQKGGKPNAPLCAFIELNNWYNANNVFLQHGVIINNLRWLYADRSRIKYFFTSALPEYEYVSKNFGYGKGTVWLTGMPRFDGLHEYTVKENRILIMPSWRSWFNEKSSMQGELNSDFINSNYLMEWKKLLENKKFNNIIKRNNLEVLFYPHRNMQSHINVFRSEINTHVKIVSWEEYDIQDLLKTSQMMITDYSSVFFDMVYMKKPIIFYQFDIDDFRKAHYSEGYFDYSNNPFGHTFTEDVGVIDEFERIYYNGFKISEEYLKAHKLFFPYYDKDNSKRIYNIIKKYAKDDVK